jgi:hypothetical protein
MRGWTATTRPDEGTFSALAIEPAISLSQINNVCTSPLHAPGPLDADLSGGDPVGDRERGMKAFGHSGSPPFSGAP